MNRGVGAGGYVIAEGVVSLPGEGVVRLPGGTWAGERAGAGKPAQTTAGKLGARGAGSGTRDTEAYQEIGGSGGVDQATR
jgi:hypothetical protein